MHEHAANLENDIELSVIFQIKKQNELFNFLTSIIRIVIIGIICN